jgi:hypothetical protein
LWHCFSHRQKSERSQAKRGGIVDKTLVWNQVMLDAIVGSTLGNPQTMRMAATENTAMFDARNGLYRWCLAHGLRVVQVMTLMTLGLYNEPAGAYLPSILY